MSESPSTAVGKLPEDAVAAECRFAVYIPPAEPGGDDYHLVKEVLHRKDGTTYPRVKFIKNYKRPFWVTRKSYQNHKDKKEWEDIDKLQKYESTQSQLVLRAARALGEPWFNGSLKKLARSPYLYGCDILSTSCIKNDYNTQFPELVTPFSIACFDTETDVLYGTGKVIIATLSFKDKVYTAISKSFLEGLGADLENKLQDKLKQYLSEYVDKRKIKWHVEIVDTDVDCVVNCIKKAHEWQPDFFAIFNMDFDITKVIETLDAAGIDPADIFSDPKVPQKYRFFKYKRGPNQKVTASGKVTPIKPAAQWHTVFCPSSFYVIDSMCAYRHIRNGTAELPSYSLDYILNLVLGIRKLKFEQANHVTGLKWHQLMQRQYKLEYVIYNVFDCVSMEELDEETKDLCLTLPSMSGVSDFENFKSQPRRVVDDLHFYCIKNENKAIATTSDEMSVEFDTETIDLKNWIIMLPAHLVADNGLRVIEESPNLATNIRFFVGD